MLQILHWGLHQNKKNKHKMLTNPIHPWNETPLSDHSTSGRERQSGQDVEMLFRRRSYDCEAIQHKYLINKLISSGNRGGEGMAYISGHPPSSSPWQGVLCVSCVWPSDAVESHRLYSKVDGNMVRSPPLSSVWNIRLIWRDEMGARAAPSLTCSGLCSLHRRRPGLPKLPKLSPVCVCVFAKALKTGAGNTLFFLRFRKFKHHLAAV